MSTEPDRRRSLLPDVAVCGDVSVEVGRVAERLVAVRALVGRGRAVGRLVLLKVRLLTESLVANCAFKWSLSWGKSVVSKERLKIFSSSHLNESFYEQLGLI